MEFSGKTAFVTGAANGIGLGICRALARSGVNLVLADIEQAALERARAELATFNVRTHAIKVDVSDADNFERAADEAEREFGNIHFLFNNAGIAMEPKPLWEVTPEQWEWIFGVNIFGVVNGIRKLVPRMKAHGEAGHIVNTASIGGLQVNPKLRNGSYAMTKYAVVAASEAMALDLEDSNLGVSVLCPALVATTLYASAARRPPRLGGPFERPDGDVGKAWQSAGLAPDDVGKRVLDAIAKDEFFIFTHEEPREWVGARHRRLIEGFDSIQRYNARERGTG
ncbi:MAG TPA: SDR family NAD(P)-dependent oxidoreductase [Bradyrhizobium sp.]|nr:SDR family NAD(P)-dependent oxidoreductase [Bradyrhizobium sp.]